MNLSENYILKLMNLAGVVSENRINKLQIEKYPQEIIDFAKSFAKETTRENSSEDSINKNQYIPWIASQAKSNPEIIKDKDKLSVIINWIKKSGYNKINSTEPFEKVYEKAKEWLKSKNINLGTGERVEGGKVVKKYPNGYQWIQATEVNWCINAGEQYGWCFNQLNRAEEFVGLGNIGTNNKGYFLLDENYKPLIALQYNEANTEVEDIQGIHNTPLTAELLPYAFDMFRILPKITNIKGHRQSFWKSFDFEGSERFKQELLQIPNVNFDLRVKLDNKLPLSKEEIDRIPVNMKLEYKIPLNPKEISALNIDDKITYNYATQEELNALPVHKKIEHDIQFTQEDLNKVNQPIIKKLAQALSKKADPRDLFIEKDFEGFKGFELDEDGIKIDMDDDEYDKKYSGLDENDRYFQYYSGDDEEVDDDELNYMNYYLNKDNLEKIKNLAKILGVPHKYNFEEQGEIQKFLDENIQNSEEILGSYKSDYGIAVGEAKVKSIEDTLKAEQKFKYVNGYLVLPWRKLYNFLKTNSLDMKKFKDLENAEINGEISLEDAYYNYSGDLNKERLKQLNDNISEELNKSLEIIENNPGYSENVDEFQNIIRYFKFEEGDFAIYAPKLKEKITLRPITVNHGSAHFKLELPLKTIFIKEVDYVERKIDIFIIEYKDKAKKQYKKVMKGKIPFENLTNYTQQYALFETELRKMVRETLEEDFRFLYDKQNFTPPTNVVYNVQKALNAVQSNQLVQADGSNEGSGLEKAKALISKEPVNHSQLKRMKAFFDKNFDEVSQERTAGKNISNSAIIQKWELWGGDEGRKWVEKNIASTQSSNKTSKKVRNSDMIARDNKLMDPHNTRIHR